ncbi:MAG: aspartate aminotransferase family protein [Alphaproteobacteria bacterium]
MTIRPNSLAARDVAYHMHSQTNLRVHEGEGPLIMTRGEGVHVVDEAGNRYIEGMSGLWCASLGFSEPRLAQAIQRQLERLPYYHTFYGRTADVTVELAEKLVALAPVPMSKAYFVTSGSEANETMIKLAWYYHAARGRPGKHKVIARMRAFHGITIAAGSMTGLPVLHRDFRLPLPGFLHARCPHAYREAEPGESEAAFADRLARELDALITAEGPDTVAAFIAEPVQGAGGIVVPPASYFPRVQEVLRRHNVLALADEVICGFGRTGTWFGSEALGFRPAMMSLGKGLTAGYLPMAAVLVADDVYQVVAENSAKVGVFGHGFTHSGNPTCAAVALEAIKIYEERVLVPHAAAMGRRLADRLAPLRDHPLVGEVRGLGLLAGVELVADKASRRPFDPAMRVGAYAERRALAHGLITRALGNTVALCLPLIVDASQIDAIADRLGNAIDDTEVWVAREGLRVVSAAAAR